MPVNNDMFPGALLLRTWYWTTPAPLPSLELLLPLGHQDYFILHCHKGLPVISDDINKQSLDPLIPNNMLSPFDMLYCGLASISSGDHKCSIYYPLDSFQKFYTICTLKLFNSWKGKIIWTCIARPFSWRKDAISISDFFSLPVLFFIITFLC